MAARALPAGDVLTTEAVGIERQGRRCVTVWVLYEEE